MLTTKSKPFFQSWRGHGFLVSLKELKIYFADSLAGIVSDLSHCYLMELQNELSPNYRKEFFDRLIRIATEADKIPLPLTAICARRIAEKSNTVPQHDIGDLIGELESRFNDEIENVKFFSVKPERFKFYENTEIAGVEFKRNFPKGNVELIEAGNCLVTDRYTACVFHLIRALEITLIALERKLEITRPDEGAEKTWGRTLRRIKDKISERDKTNPAGWSEERDFFDKAHAFLAAVKTPLRDDTIHVETTYDEQSALDVFDVSVVALRFLAEKLSEP